VTHLDRIGFPVWQAIRPMSRALSVHQGKGATDADAKLGALLEAFESHSAESFPEVGRFCAFKELPVESRTTDLADFAADRQRPPLSHMPCRWVEAEDLLSGATLHLPWDCVSLDLTRNVPSLFDRASNGVAAGATREEAIGVALHEFIERDSVTEWKAGGMLGCMQTALDLDLIPFPWFHWLHERIESAGGYLKVYFVSSLTGSPVFACEISDVGKTGAAYRSMQGRGCHPLPEIALFKAVAEAVQGRATYIAGAREDLSPADYAAKPELLIAFGLPLPPGMAGVDFNTIATGPVGVAGVAEQLRRAGYGRIAVVELAQVCGISVVRVFVCGLGGIIRRRRPAP
jgi:ribosomal protein S12 methylthiotransferase accessory factor